ncbi:hypothetical protein CH252_19110 [Rhodococcus sp. 06-1477-1B]|nr:hypothetical protein CH252_19110 [Rhodococcus sp. 06-1477-1B]
MSATLLARPTAAERQPWMTDEYLDAVYALEPDPEALHLGHAEPRIATLPLRPLTPATSLGFEVIEFAEAVLNVTLYPWQRVLLIRALELRRNGQYRFRSIMVLVARQQGKTMLASVLATWWLYVDSARNPDRVPPLKFKVVGVAQTLDIAKEPWNVVKVWADPAPDTDEDEELAIESLQQATARVVDTNGQLAIVARSRAHYEIRAAKNARGKPAARVLMDEMREQKDWTGWNAVSQTTKSFWNGMLIGFSNAGDSSAVVLKKQRTAGLEDIASFKKYVEDGLMTAEEYANGNDVSTGLFEWSAPEGCEKHDVDGILAANPSIGYGAMTVASALSDIRKMTDAGYRTEVLCQWVTALVNSFISVRDWSRLEQAPTAIRPQIETGARTVWALDTIDRSMTWLAAAVRTKSGKPFVTIRHRQAGMFWAPDYMEQLAEASGHREVVLQTGPGVVSGEFEEELTKRGLHVHKIDRGTLAMATGRLSDGVRDRGFIIAPSPAITVAVEGGVVADYADADVWSRSRSKPVDIAGLVAMTEALYGLTRLDPPAPPQQSPPPPAARLLPAQEDPGAPRGGGGWGEFSASRL